MVSARTGPGISVFGSILVICFGYLDLRAYRNVQSGIELIYIRFAFALMVGVAGIIGGILGLRGMRFGNIYTLIGCEIAIIGIFVPIGTIVVVITSPSIDIVYLPVTLFSTWIYIDVILMCLGGFLGLLIRGE